MSPRALLKAVPDVVVTLWPSRRETIGRRDPQTWAGFLKKYVATPEPAFSKSSVAGFSLASFTNDRRALANVQAVYALTFDLDAGDSTLIQAAWMWRRELGAVYSTYSSTPEKPKLRVIVALSRPVTSSEYSRLWAWAAARFKRAGHILDESTRDASRFWFIPSYKPGGTPYEWKELTGRPIDVAKVLEQRPHTRHPLPDGRAQAKGVKVRRPHHQEVDAVRGASAAKTFWGRAFEFWGKAGELRTATGVLSVECPWQDKHTDGHDGSEGSTVIFPGKTEGAWGIFHCNHAHCSKRTTLDLLDVIPFAALEAVRIEHGAGLVRARIKSGIVQHLEAHDGLAALDRLVLWCIPVGNVARGGFQVTVKLGSAAHQALGSRSLKRLIGRCVDVVRGRLGVSSVKLVSAKGMFRQNTWGVSARCPRRSAGTR